MKMIQQQLISRLDSRTLRPVDVLELLDFCQNDISCSD